ncbi:hypothetical protein ASE19_14465 [Nocardioides sp. Root79]|nr:hypothetical protein ASE19_14465 [Nocardioides sp. Root79]KRC67990.1 hypothetical protein ASE20_18290 [Nocardioides sp. Root240]
MVMEKPIDEGITSGRIAAEEDVEGHAIKGKVAPSEDDDVEGHAGRLRPVVPEADDDVEGHGVRVKI